MGRKESNQTNKQTKLILIWVSSLVQNKVLFENLLCISTGGWLYRSTVHIGLFDLVEGVLRSFFSVTLFGPQIQRVV